MQTLRAFSLGTATENWQPDAYPANRRLKNLLSKYLTRPRAKPKVPASECPLQMSQSLFFFVSFRFIFNFVYVCGCIKVNVSTLRDKGCWVLLGLELQVAENF